MKKLIFTLLMFLTLSLSAQNVTLKFLGIPVDGSKSDMISNLKQKGFTYDSEFGFLDGYFNGDHVHVFISTNKDLVDRIMVCQVNTCNEANIKTKFNNLVYQFNNNKKYLPAEDDQYIAEDVDISYEMIVKNKHFDATFHQTLTNDEEIELKQALYDNYDTIANTLSMNLSEMGFNPDTFKGNSVDDNVNSLLFLFKTYYMMSNDVWFRIQKYGSEYYLSIFYDNLANRPNGEDL